jgi:hypothetical protein
VKLLKVFGLFLVLHVAAWAGAHTYLSQHQPDVLIVVDTSYALKPQFAAMERWIAQREATTRYQRILVGTDKALLGELATLKSKEAIFRTAFGRMSAENLQRYEATIAREKILLSDGSIKPAGWTVVAFP